MSDRPNRPFIVTTEQTSSQVSIRVNVLRRNASKQLTLVQTVTLKESTSNSSSFATGPNGSVYCAVWGTSMVHEICRTPGAAAAAAGAPFGAAAKAHRLQNSIFSICGFHWNGEHRLAASFYDKSVRVFRATRDGFFQLQQIRAPYANWSPVTLVGLIDGAFCIRSSFTDPADSKVKYDIELCAADASGALSSPRQLKQFTNGVEVWCHSRSADASDSAPCIIAVEYNPTATLREFYLQQD